MPKIQLGPKPTPPAKPPKPKPAPPPPSAFEQLFPCAWRGIVFPVSSVRVSISQDVVEHKYWGVDAASVEATGRAPMQIEATIPFVNGIVPGKGENWGVLYPTTFREVQKAFVDRTSGVFNHPELGPILCKPVSFEYSHDAQQRDGVVVTARFVETVDPDQDVESPFEAESPVKVADLAALDLDASKEDILKLAPEAAFPEETFDSFVNKISGAIDRVGTFARTIANKPGQLLNRVKTLQNSLERTRNSILWPAQDACERMKSAAHSLGAMGGPHKVVGTGPVPVPPGKKLKRYKMVKAMNLAAVASLLGKPIDELIRLNPLHLGKAEIPVGSIVKYYE